jgi:hypothetical protein
MVGVDTSFSEHGFVECRDICMKTWHIISMDSPACSLDQRPTSMYAKLSRELWLGTGHENPDFRFTGFNSIFYCMCQTHACVKHMCMHFLMQDHHTVRTPSAVSCLAICVCVKKSIDVFYVCTLVCICALCVHFSWVYMHTQTWISIFMNVGIGFRCVCIYTVHICYTWV